MRSKSVSSLFVNFVRVWSNALGLVIQYIFTGLGSRTLPLVSGGLFAIGIFEFFMEMTGNIWFSGTMALFAMGGVEAVGFNAAHEIIERFTKGLPITVPVLFMVGYLLIGGGSLWFVDVADIHKIMTTAMFGMVAINYALIGMDEVKREQKRAEEVDRSHHEKAEAERLERLRQQKIEDEDRAYRREQDALNAERQHALEMQRIAAQQAIEVQKATAVTHMERPSARERVALSATRQKQLRILQSALNDADTVTKVHIADALKLQDRAAANVLSDLHKAGVLRPNGKRGHYEWA